MIKYDLKRSKKQNIPDFIFVGYDYKTVKKAELKRHLDAGWKIVRRKYFLITYVSDWWKRLSDGNKIAVFAGIIVPIVIAFLFKDSVNVTVSPQSDSNSKNEIFLESLDLKSESGLLGFNIIRDFEKNKSEFTVDTLELNDYSTDGGELIAYHNSKAEYIVLDFWLYGETGRLNYSYWTDKNLNFKIIKKLDFIYDKPYYEIDFKIDSTIYYLDYSDTICKLYDINKQEVLKKKLVDSAKVELESFFADVAKGIKIVK